MTTISKPRRPAPVHRMICMGWLHYPSRRPRRRQERLITAPHSRTELVLSSRSRDPELDTHRAPRSAMEPRTRWGRCLRKRPQC